MVERFNRTIIQQLALFTADCQDDWDKHLPYMLMAYRTSQHGATACSPALLMHGRELRAPVDLLCARCLSVPTDPQGRATHVSWRKAWKKSMPSLAANSNRRV